MRKLEINCDKCGSKMEEGDYNLNYGGAFENCAIMGNNNFPSNGFDLCRKCFVVIAQIVESVVTNNKP